MNRHGRRGNRRRNGSLARGRKESGWLMRLFGWLHPKQREVLKTLLYTPWQQENAVSGELSFAHAHHCVAPPRGVTGGLDSSATGDKD
jgi:hypothetical protein